MPWTSGDVDSHKKGLTAKQKRQWVHVANSALARCQEAGESDCEGRAIRQANSVVSKEHSEDLALVLEAAISKSDDSKQRLFGWVSIAVHKDGRQIEDLQGDLIDIEDLEEAWYDYVTESGQLNFLHQGEARGYLIESMVFTKEKLEALGLAPDALPLGVWAAFHIPRADDYRLVKEAGYLMFSIEGSAIREPVDGR